MSENIIELKNIKKVFDDTVVVEDFNLTVKKGEFVTFLGPSGCGKTTTGRSIIGLYDITSGSIYYRGYRISAGDRWKERNQVESDPYPRADQGSSRRVPEYRQGPREGRAFA